MSDKKGLEPGAKGVFEGTVTDDNTAVSMASGEIEVFATPAMVALMEAAAVQSLKGRLSEEETSVGTRLDISHLAATPKSMHVRAEATLEKIDGRRLFFKLLAFDEKEKIGEGNHERVVIQRERFLNKVLSKKEGA